MASVVFLRAVNVGAANRCRPAAIAKELSKFGVVNLGAVGTFVVRKDASESALRSAFAGKLPFKCDIMICPAAEITRLVSSDPFAGQVSDPTITRFVNVLAKPLSTPPALPLCLPSNEGWLLKVVAIDGRFVLGMYRREMKAIGLLGKLEKQLGIAATNRNWNTIQKIAELLCR